MVPDKFLTFAFRMLLSALISLLLASPIDTVLTPSYATAAKEELPAGAPVTTVSSTQLQQYGVYNPKALPALVPGIHLPDYGSSMTSSIYVRGFGSRMENPVVGLYMDDFPILDKNSYDLDYLDIASIRFLHGPQGTAYGRNALFGVISVRSQAPDGETKLRAQLEYGLAHHVRAQVSWYQGEHAFSLGYRHSRGWFKNEYKDTWADPYNGGQLRWRWDRALSDRWQITNLLQAGISAEGGFAYGLWKDGVQHPVSYNDEGSYRRVTVLEGFKLRYQGEKVQVDGIASLQFLADRMRMDQDYTPRNIFTLQQSQLSPAHTLEVIARPTRKFAHWKPTSGAFAFFKYNRMEAPVLFKREGIQSLILDNANKGIPEDIGTLDIPDNDFLISSNFDILTWNVALYHESHFPVGGWQFTAGLRLDYEGAKMLYDCTASLHYQLIGMMSSVRPYTDHYRGTLSHGVPVLLPKLAVEYNGFSNTRIYTSATKGYRAGGFNTQIFSDILQNRLMNGMMDDLGVHFDNERVSIGADRTEYKPEEAWNFELGASFHKGGFRADVNAFYITALRQQLTVFPPGMSTGRMMTNAGKSRSYGVEAQVSYNKGGFAAHAAWGWNNACFTEYTDGTVSYAGNRIPYSPEHTLFAALGYNWSKVSLQAHMRGIGPIAWNEQNTLVEPFYVTLGARASVELGRVLLYLEGENLTNTRYKAFYFKSMGNEFFQLGKPISLQLGIQIRII